MKRIITLVAMLLALCMLPLALFGCESDAENTTTAATTAPVTDNNNGIVGTEYDVKDNIDKIKINGRYVLTNKGLACDNVGSGIEFQGTMKGKVFLEVINVVIAGQSDGAYFTVYVDGVRQDERFKAPRGKNGAILDINYELVADRGHNVLYSLGEDNVVHSLPV